MDPETARTIGFALGMAFMGFVALQILTRGKKPPPSPLRSGGTENLQGAIKAIVILVAVGAVAALIGYLTKR